MIRNLTLFFSLLKLLWDFSRDFSRDFSKKKLRVKGVASPTLSNLLKQEHEEVQPIPKSP
jgi:hypothetical protein